MKFQAYSQRYGHDINGIRPVMIPDEHGEWVSRHEAEHMAERLKLAQSRIAELIDERTASANELSRIIMREMAAVREAKQRIAELESRRVRVEELHSFVTDSDILALRRFCECCDDPESGGHDLEKEQVTRLEKIGALQRSGRISYITDFGDYLISITAGIECEVV